jgi:hypothetical protein
VKNLNWRKKIKTTKTSYKINIYTTSYKRLKRSKKTKQIIENKSGNSEKS